MSTHRLVAGLAFLVAIVGGQVEGTVITLQPGPSGVKDTWVWQSEDSPHGDWGELRANDTSIHDQRVFIEFTDLSAIPTGATINSASLGLYKYDQYTGDPLYLDARPITSPWIESVTFTTQPAVGSVIATTLVSGTSDQWYSWDLTSLVQDWINGSVSNYGVAIYDHGSGRFVRFVSSDNETATMPDWSLAPRDASLQPRLTIDYSSVPEPTTLAIWGTLGGLGLIAARRRKRVA